MKSYYELKAEMEAIHKEMVDAKKNEHANAHKDVNRLCKEFWLYCWNVKKLTSGE